jgi:hypothetical protein
LTAGQASRLLSSAPRSVFSRGLAPRHCHAAPTTRELAARTRLPSGWSHNGPLIGKRTVVVVASQCTIRVPRRWQGPCRRGRVC